MKRALKIPVEAHRLKANECDEVTFSLDSFWMNIQVILTLKLLIQVNLLKELTHYCMNTWTVIRNWQKCGVWWNCCWCLLVKLQLKEAFPETSKWMLSIYRKDRSLHTGLFMIILNQLKALPMYKSQSNVTALFEPDYLLTVSEDLKELSASSFITTVLKSTMHDMYTTTACVKESATVIILQFLHYHIKCPVHVGPIHIELN